MTTNPDLQKKSTPAVTGALQSRTTNLKGTATMSIVASTSPQGQITLDHLSTTIDGKPMFSIWDIRPFISPEVSNETYVDCVLTVVSVLEYQDGVDHSCVVIIGDKEIDLFDREVFELVCNILDVLPEVRDYFSPSVRERLEKANQAPTNMAEALRQAADEHERAELEEAERLFLAAKREYDDALAAKEESL